MREPEFAPTFLLYGKLTQMLTVFSSLLGTPSHNMRCNDYAKVGEGPIAHGAYGRVFKGKHRDTKELVAIKTISRNTQIYPETPSVNESKELFNSDCCREISILQVLTRANQKHIVRLIEYDFIPGEHYYLIFEWIHEDLRTCIIRESCKYQQEINSAFIKMWMHQIAEAVAYIHSVDIIHRDIKPANILVCQWPRNLKLADFGLARSVALSTRNFSRDVVTLWYRAPEIMLGMATYGKPIDVWSVGCIFAELMNMASPVFCGNTEIEMLFKIFSVLGTPEKMLHCDDFKRDMFPNYKPKREGLSTVNKPAKDLLGKLLDLNPSRRITCEKMLQHEYFKY